ncbi:MAG: hypothetical protein COA69_12165 [Robiginitomaculum sp.]|nr:MAG: hypothetical protein COA69_12165 [Robiginitomaculum sp.]
MVRFLLSFALIVLLSRTAFAQTTDPKQLDTLSEQQKEAEQRANALSQQQDEILNEISGLQRDLVNATAQSRGYERAQNQAQARLSELEREETKLTALILSDRLALSDMLAALQRIERRPAPSLLANSQSALDAARAASLLSSLSLDLQKKSETLKQQLVELHILRQNMVNNRLEITAHAQEVDVRLKGIKTIISNKSTLNNKLGKDRETQAQKAKKLAAEARDLRDLIARFEEQAEEITPRLKPKISNLPPNPHIKPKRGKAPAPVFVAAGSGRFADARGKLPLPVLGTLSRKFGALLSEGGRAKGISLRTASRAQVVAPFPARVDFSGSFNNESVVILYVGNGYFIILTGLGETFASAGEHVAAGEPLGLMPVRRGAKPELFMEFRKNKASIDPKPWIGPALAQ